MITMRPSRLFHTIVILGASLGGACGSSTHGLDAGESSDAEAEDARIADAARDAAIDAGAIEDAGPEPFDAGQDAMVLIL